MEKFDMACTYTGSIEGDLRLAIKQSDQENAKLITNLTQMLCNVCEEMNKNWIDQRDAADRPISFLNTSQEVQNWWKNHQETDKKRLKEAADLKKVQDEILRRKALQKLTQEEIKALGLDK